MATTGIGRPHQVGTASGGAAAAPREEGPEYEEHYAPTYGMHRALDIPELRSRWGGLTREQLARLPVLAAGARLAHGHHYFDLCHPERGVLHAPLGMEVGPDNWFVAEQDVEAGMWKLLTGRAGTT